jgi:hypothetical protein
MLHYPSYPLTPWPVTSNECGRHSFDMITVFVIYTQSCLMLLEHSQEVRCWQSQVLYDRLKTLWCIIHAHFNSCKEVL